MKFKTIAFALTVALTRVACSKEQVDQNPIAEGRYVAASYFTQGGVNLYLYGDLLCLTAKEEGLEFAGVMKGPPSLFSNPSAIQIAPVNKTSFHSVDFDWNVGFRLGGGWHTHHDFWDLFVEWTHYNTEDHKSLHPDPDSKTLFIVNIDSRSGVGSPLSYMGLARSAEEKWKLDYDTLDLNMSKSFWVSDRLGLTPHVGLRLAWIDQRIRQIYKQVSNGINYVADYVENKNKQDFWGIGVRGGINSRWALTRRVSLFSDFSISPLWANIHIKNKEPIRGTSFPDLTNPFYEVKDEYSGLKLNVDMELGAQWDFYFCHGAYHLGVRAAWEYHLWLNYNQINRFNDTTAASTFQPQAFYKAHGNLSLYGTSVGLIFNF